MGRDHVAALIGVAYKDDALLQKVPVETKREIFCEVCSVQQSEWFSAGQKGLKAQLVLKVFPDDYAGESLIEVDGIRYGIYRTYLTKNYKLELYLEKKGGV